MRNIKSLMAITALSVFWPISINASNIVVVANNNHTISVDGMIALKPGNRLELPFVDAIWRNLPDIKFVSKNYSDILEKRVDINMSCDLERNGELKNCQVKNIYPKKPQFEIIALHIASRLVLDRALTDKVYGRVRWVGVTLKIENSRGIRNEKLPCYFQCQTIPSPPPPPPPPK